ncbi:hypothetical protein ACTA71_010464 [Dictyostelium dimigraforme]
MKTILFLIFILIISCNNKNIYGVYGKCYPIRGISPNIIIECGKDQIVSFHSLNNQIYRYELSSDQGDHFFYPRKYEHKLYDQSFNGGPLITFDQEIESIEKIPNSGGDVQFRGQFFYDGKRVLKPVQLYIFSKDLEKVIYNKVVRVQHINKTNFLINIPKGCGSDISLINPYTNKILYKTSYLNPCTKDITPIKLNGTSPSISN